MFVGIFIKVLFQLSLTADYISCFVACRDMMLRIESKVYFFKCIICPMADFKGNF